MQDIQPFFNYAEEPHPIFLRDLAISRGKKFQLAHDWSVDEGVTLTPLLTKYGDSILYGGLDGGAGPGILYIDFGQGVEGFIEQRKTHHKIKLELVAVDVDAIQSVFEEILKLFPPIHTDAGEGAVNVKFWTHSVRGPSLYNRRIDVASWADISHNYPNKEDVETLVNFPPEQLGEAGKMVIWHGPPGTGKTWAIRTLIDAWRSWAEINYIVDPEQFLGDKPAYMFEVLLGGEDEWAWGVDDEGKTIRSRKPSMWKVVILEDAGELLSADAKRQTGQALSRLLNLADGLIGQGLKVLFLVTTNEEMGRLHPAVTREGRCMANNSFRPFSPQEGNAWLEQHGCEPVLTGKATLAELYSILSGRTVKPTARGIGFT